MKNICGEKLTLVVVLLTIMLVTNGKSETAENPRCGYIDKSGNYVIQPNFSRAHSFSDGLAAVAIGNKWGLIDKSGKFVVQPKYDLVYPFSEGLAAVVVNGKIENARGRVTSQVSGPPLIPPIGPPLAGLV